MPTAASTPDIPPARAIPHLPTGPGDEPVFANPWEARAFALVVHLYQQGHFTWPEWVEWLVAEIKAAGDTVDGSAYYLLWLAAVEKLVAGKHLCAGRELAGRKAVLEAAQGGPVHRHA